MDEKAIVLKLLVVIVPRGKGDTVSDCLKSVGVYTTTVLYGRGTAPKHWSDLMGMGDSKNEVILAVVDASILPAAFNKLETDFHLTEAGNGVAFTVKLNGLSSKNFMKFCTEWRENQ